MSFKYLFFSIFQIILKIFISIVKELFLEYIPYVLCKIVVFLKAHNKYLKNNLKFGFIYNLVISRFSKRSNNNRKNRITTRLELS